MPPRLIGRIVLAIGLCLPMVSCSVAARLSGSFESPVLELDASKVLSISQSVTHLLFELRVHNPNSYALHTQGLRYRLTVNRTTLAEGPAEAHLALPPRALASLRLPVEVPLDVLRSAAHDAVAVGEVPYQLEVWLSVNSWLQHHEARLDATSVLRLNLPLGLAGAVAFPRSGWQS